MNTQQFAQFASDNYLRLVSYFEKRGYTQDAGDYVNDWAVWGLEKEWKPEEDHGYNDAVQWIICHIKDLGRLAKNRMEIILGFERDEDEDNDDSIEACDVGFEQLYTMANSHTQDEFDALVARFVDVEDNDRTRSVSDTLAILTERQRTIAGLVAQGASFKEIAVGMDVHLDTVYHQKDTALERIYTAYPERRPWGKAWTKDEIKAQHQVTRDLRARFEYEVPTANFRGFPHDIYEQEGRTCLKKVHLCEYHKHSEECTDLTAHVDRALDALSSHGSVHKLIVLARESRPNMLSLASYTAQGYRTSHIVEDPDRQYYLGSNRLFNSLGLGKWISDSTMNVLRKFGLTK